MTISVNDGSGSLEVVDEADEDTTDGKMSVVGLNMYKSSIASLMNQLNSLSDLIASYQILSETSPYDGQTYQTPVIVFKKHPVDYGINVTISYTLDGENKSVSDTILIGPQDSILSISGMFSTTFDTEDDKILSIDVAVEMADSYSEIIVDHVFNCPFEIIKHLYDRTCYMYNVLSGLGRFNYLFMAQNIVWNGDNNSVLSSDGSILSRLLHPRFPYYPAGRIFTYTYTYNDNSATLTATGTYQAPPTHNTDSKGRFKNTNMIHITSTGPQPRIADVGQQTSGAYVIRILPPTGITMISGSIELEPLPEEHWTTQIAALEARIAKLENPE